MSGLDICGSLCDLWKPPPTFFLANIFRWKPLVSGFQRKMFTNGSLWTNLCCREGKRKANIIFLPRCCLAPCYESNHNHRSRFILSQRCFSSSCQPRKVIYPISTSPIFFESKNIKCNSLHSDCFDYLSTCSANKFCNRAIVFRFFGKAWVSPSKAIVQAEF